MVSALLKTCPHCGSTYDMEQRFCPRDGSTLRAPPGSDLVGSVLADRYHVLKRIGEGGMGQVYLAEHVKMKRKSAVKVLHRGMVHDPDAISRFNREAANASQIQHPSVAGIYDFGETPDGLIYLAMEYVDGESLTKIIERQGALAPNRAVDIATQVANALEAAHDLGIIHRDLKPDNIMIMRGRNGEDVAKVVDFGIAKAIQADDQKVTKTGLAIGTPEYMSPEQLGGDLLDSRTDIYSLGLVTFNMLTGQLPFPAVTSREALIARLTERPRTLTQMRADIFWPEELQWVMDRALANHPGERYQHVGEFGRDLARAVASMSDAEIAQHGGLATPKATLGRTEARVIVSTESRTPTAEMAIVDDDVGEISFSYPSTSRRVFVTFAVLALAAVAGGGYWYWNRAPAVSEGGVAAAAPGATATQQDSAAAISAPASADSIRSDSAPSPPADSAPSVPVPPVAAAVAPRAPAPASAQPPNAGGDSASTAPPGTPSPTAVHPTPAVRVPPPANLDSLLAPAWDDYHVGLDRMNDGEYEGALVRFGSAADLLTELSHKYPGVREITSLRRKVTAATQQNRVACRAERDDALKRGAAAPDCP
ncbi:MAG TPA: serine/threonine-protein kinase [Gemmatimonadaceae bacterium]|nr:serine/threonine-protein kinase [Gemmatimonadaceae bacterium]